MGVNVDEDLHFMEWLKQILAALDDRLGDWPIPPAVLRRVREAVDELRDIFDSRPARFLIVGRRGAGKSTFINAVFGENVAGVGHVDIGTVFAKWYPYACARGSIEILDTRGLGERRTEGVHEKHAALAQIESEIQRKVPDVVLFLCKAKEVAARIDEDLEDLRGTLAMVREHHSYEPPVIGVVTQVDELAPPHVSEPPFDNEIKQANILEAKRLLRDRLDAATASIIDVHAICAYMAFAEDGTVEYDRRWNVDEFLDLLVEKVPHSAQVSLARIARVKKVQKRVARTIIAAAAAIAGAVALEPIPIADLPVITGIQVAMVVAIAYVGGRTLDKRAAGEFLGELGVNVGAAFAFRELARAVSKFWVGPGNAISGAIAAGGTWAIGEAAIVYFIDGASKEHARRIFNERRKPAE